MHVSIYKTGCLSAWSTMLYKYENHLIRNYLLDIYIYIYIPYKQ